MAKVLEGNPTELLYIIDGILFAHRISKHFSTKYSPFFLLYNREPVLPIDLVKPIDTNGNEDPSDIETFEGVLSEMLSMRKGIHQDVSANILEKHKHTTAWV